MFVLLYCGRMTEKKINIIPHWIVNWANIVQENSIHTAQPVYAQQNKYLIKAHSLAHS